MTMLRLRTETDRAWLDLVMSDFDTFLVDHAACERKASATAMSFVGHYPDKVELVETMLELAFEELAHFRRVWQVIKARGARLVPDVKDPYVAGLRTQLGRGKDTYFLDRLLISSLIEARSCERLGLVADALDPGSLKEFYRELTQCEARHHALFVDMGKTYYAPAQVDARLNELLDFESGLVAQLPLRSAVH